MAGFICTSCGYGSVSWLGKCPSCGSWNTLVKREVEEKNKKKAVTSAKFVSFSHVTPRYNKRIATKIFELDRVLGGGFIPGEVILISGEPGIGKSTLLLKTLEHLRVIYISGEESPEQIVDRAKRLKINLAHFLFSDNTEIESIVSGLRESKSKFNIVVIDSLQTLYSSQINSGIGSIAQIREIISHLVDYAKKNSIPMIIVGHITKEGAIAGPKALEHLVDCVLYLEGDRLSQFRILRALKNRFGPTDEVGVFEMQSNGLVAVHRPTAFLDLKEKKSMGKSIVGIIEGSRPLFFEVQSLVVPTSLSVPRRVVSGFDYNKVQLLLAVIRKNLHLPLDRFDIYVNVVGGVSIRGTSADLGIIVAVISSIKNIPVNTDSVFIGEIGLLGEVRSVSGEAKITKEAIRYGFKTIYSSKNITSVTELNRIIS